MVKIFSSMMAAMGRQLKQSVNVFHSLMLYRRLPVQTRALGQRPVPPIQHRAAQDSLDRPSKPRTHAPRA